MIHARFAPAALLLALAACQPENLITNNSFNETENVILPEETPLPTETPSPTPSPTDTGNASDDEAAAATIPAVFHGRWGMVPGDCTSTRGDAKGLLTIAADSLRFYESRAVPSRIVESTPRKLTAEFAFTGEGQEWSKTVTLELTGDDTLVRTESDPAGRFTYTRCGT